MYCCGGEAGDINMRLSESLISLVTISRPFSIQLKGLHQGCLFYLTLLYQIKFNFRIFS